MQCLSKWILNLETPIIVIILHLIHISCHNDLMNTLPRRLVRVEATRVLDEYTHVIDIDQDKKFTIIYGPNGVGKTKMMEIIHGISCLDLRRLRGVPFRKAALHYSDGSCLRVKRSFGFDSQIDEGDEENSEISLEFSLCRPDHKELVWRTKDDYLKSVAERRTPFVQESPDTWRDLRDGELISTSELISRYRFLERYQTNILTDNLTDIRDFLGHTPSYLIETQRLKVTLHDDDYQRKSSWMSRRSKEKSKSMITKQSEVILNHLSEAQTKHSKIAQTMDRTFPRRVLMGGDLAHNPEAKAIIERYNRQNELRTRLARVASVPLEDELALPDRDLRDWELRLLEVYLDDTEEKLKPLVDVLTRIEMLEGFANDRLLNKVLEVNDDKGLVVRRESDGEVIHLDSLSSGEQHEIILLVEMLFSVPGGAIVLIDEPEISLHVAWQLDFIPMVAKIADLIDFVFIVATHSPQIINGEMSSAVRLGPSGARFE